MTYDPPLKPVIWVGTSLKDLREFPAPVQDHVGYAPYELIKQRLHDAEQMARERKQ
jgi:hypothetical protein